MKDKKIEIIKTKRDYYKTKSNLLAELFFSRHSKYFYKVFDPL